MRTHNSDPNTRNRSVSMWSKSTIVGTALCLAFTLSPAPAAATGLTGYGPEAELLETHGNLLRSGPSATFESALFASPTVLPGLAVSTCSPYISSGPNDPPMVGVLLYAYWSPTLGTWVGFYYVTSNSGEHIRALRCDTYDEI